MLNKAILMGRLTKDPELKMTTSNIPVTSFSIAVDRDFTRSGTEKQTDFFDIVAWRQTAEFVSKYFRKGSWITVAGRLQTRKWQDQQGNNRVSFEVVADEVHFTGNKSDTPQATGNSTQYGAYPDAAPQYGNAPAPSAAAPAPSVGYSSFSDDDELPF